jgi:hypothetical protein
MKKNKLIHILLLDIPPRESTAVLIEPDKYPDAGNNHKAAGKSYPLCEIPSNPNTQKSPSGQQSPLSQHGSSNTINEPMSHDNMSDTDSAIERIYRYPQHHGNKQ